MTPILSRDGTRWDEGEKAGRDPEEKLLADDVKSREGATRHTVFCAPFLPFHIPGPYKKIILVTAYFPDTQHHKFELRYISKALPITEVIVA
jgi:hypothetical protein